MKKSKEPSLEQLYEASPKENIDKIDENSRKNGMVLILIFMTSNVVF